MQTVQPLVRQLELLTALRMVKRSVMLSGRPSVTRWVQPWVPSLVQRMGLPTVPQKAMLLVWLLVWLLGQPMALQWDALKGLRTVPQKAMLLVWLLVWLLGQLMALQLDALKGLRTVPQKAMQLVWLLVWLLGQPMAL